MNGGDFMYSLAEPLANELMPCSCDDLPMLDIFTEVDCPYAEMTCSTCKASKRRDLTQAEVLTWRVSVMANLHRPGEA